MKVKIRKAKSTDVDGIQQCVEKAYRHYVDRIGKPPGPMLDDYNKVIEQHQVYIAETQAIIGLLVLIPSQNGMLLDNVAVDPDCQGQGIGRRLIRLAECMAARNGFDHLDLYTHELMTENIAMYQQLGYKVTGRRTEQGYRRVYMQKTLSPVYGDDGASSE